VRFSVGYQITDPYDFCDVVDAHRADIHEVYFPWLGVPDGRGLSVGGPDDQAFMESELRRIHDQGVALNVLFNANCYGAGAISKRLQATIRTTIATLLDKIGLEAVTTASLFVADVVRSEFPQLDVRASVNMEISSVRGLKYVEDYFTSYYTGRETNRSPSRIAPMRQWCHDNGKRLYLLANSGCLRGCSAHTFHDNLVAHERELRSRDNAWSGFPGICWDYLGRPEHRASFIQDSTWLRPEDLGLYEGLVDGVKLATRSHRDPRKVIAAYAAGRFEGNTLSLFEPDFSALYCLDNARFPGDWLRTFDTDQEAKGADEVLRAVT
jgi:hypothetical protein